MGGLRATMKWHKEKINAAGLHSSLCFTSWPHYPAVHYGGGVQINKRASKQKGFWQMVSLGIPQVSLVITQHSAGSHTPLRLSAGPDKRSLNSNTESGSAPGIDNAICSLNYSWWMLINSAQLSGLYSHPWPQLMNIDSDLSGPKSREREEMVSGGG